MPTSDYDPVRRLIAAVVLTAALDHLYPRRDLGQADRASAADFLASDDAACIIEALDLNLDRVRRQLALPEVPS